MKEANAPVDIGKDQIAPYKKDMRELLTGFTYQSKSRSLPDLIQQIDAEDPEIMTALETTTYTTIREGLQVFKAIADKVGEKVGLRKALVDTPADQLATSLVLKKLRDFTYSFAAYAASTYIVKRLDAALVAEGADLDKAGKDKPDLSKLALDPTTTEKMVLNQLVVPVVASIANHVDNGREVYKGPHEFPLFVRDVFEQYAKLAYARRMDDKTLRAHIDGYDFRIMDGVVTLAGFEDKTAPTIKATEQKLTIQRIDPNEIVGNRAAKRKLTRYIQRLMIYDPKKQYNPVLELGGLSWTNLFDGLPGTGKTSMFRMAMTLLQDYGEALGLPYRVFTVDQSIKDEYYGKSGKILLERLAVAQDPNLYVVGIFDDLDLLTSKRDDAQGADNDINSILMQFFDGAFTKKKGNVICFTASNKPTGLDDALRNRMNDRLLVVGPETAEDFSDMFMLQTKKLRDRKLLLIEPGYKPFETQDMRKADGTWDASEVAAYAAEEFKKFNKATVADFGRFMADLKKKNPKVTGRSSNAINEAIKERTANFDLPQEWLQTRGAFVDLPYDRKVSMLQELYTKITPDILFQEAQRYFDSEQRFAKTEGGDMVTRGYNNRIWDIQSEIRVLEDQASKGAEADLLKLSALRAVLSQRQQAADEIVATALQHAEEAKQAEEKKRK